MRDPDEERPTDAHGVVDESSIDHDDHLVNGTDVGGYVIDGELGAGGMGVVYSAVHPIIGKRAAIKVLKPELSDNPAAVERFMMEARAVNQIGHPNIVDIFAFGQLPDGRSYYVMDHLTGEPLRRRLKRGGPLHPAEAISIIDETASALMAAHDKGIIHRDLKPDNVFMVSAPGRWPEVRILDWGLLKLTSQQSSISSSKYRTLAGSVMGTPVYMSPEQARASDAVDFRTDVYSLGVMSYELLAGVVPFKKGSSIDTLLAHQDDPVPPLAARCPALPIELVQLIEAMLAKDPDGRPTLAAVRAVIKRLRGTKIPTMTAAGLQMPEPAPPTPRPSFGEPASDPRAPYIEPPTAPHLPPSARTSSPSSPPSRTSSPFIEPPTARLSAETTVPRMASTSSQPPTIPRTPTSQRAPTAPPTARAQTTPPVVGRAPSQPSIPRAQTRNEAATVPPPMRAQGFDDRRTATPPGGLPLPAPPRSERMAAQPDPLESQNVSLPYQSFNLAPASTLAGHPMPNMPGASAPLSNPGLPGHPIATSTHGARNQTGPMPMMPGLHPTGPVPMMPHGPHNQTGPMPMMPHGPHNQTGPIAAMAGQGMPPAMSTSYGAQVPLPTPYPPPAGTPQTMAATSGKGRRVLVIALAAIVVSAIGIAILMLT